MGRFLRQSRVSKPTVRNPSALFAAFPFKSPFNVLSNPERELLSAAPFLPFSPRELLFPRNRRLVTAARKKPSCPLCKNCMVLRIVCKRKAGRALNTEDQVIPGLYGAGHGVAHSATATPSTPAWPLWPLCTARFRHKPLLRISVDSLPNQKMHHPVDGVVHFCF